MLPRNFLATLQVIICNSTETPLIIKEVKGQPNFLDPNIVAVME